MIVYVAGSSKQLDRVRNAMEALRELGHTVAHDWVSIVEAVGSAHPDDDSGRARFAKADLAAVAQADMLWLLYQDESVGAFWEAGYAQGRGIPVVVSGACEGNIFVANCDWNYDRDDQCLLCEFSNGGPDGSED